MSHLTQMLGLAVQNFVSAAAGMAVAIAIIRGIVRRGRRTLGNFWVDLTRTTVRILLPMSFVVAILSPEYFHPRPSAAGDGYDGAASSGSNYGPTNDEFLATVADRVAAYREENGLGVNELVPVDAVTASASGLDPHISVRNAKVQAPRVANARGIELDDVLALISEHTTERPLAILGDPGVNVLELNLALDGRQ
jgi:K+-transporting ATPase KdpC subunit